MTLSYYDREGLSAAFYDVVTDAYPIRGDIGFYARLGGGSGASILELGCGTGRVAIGLAELGCNVVGVDIAEAMLYRAKLKCERLPSDIARRITLLRGDMTAIEIGRHFDAVIVPFHGFAHLDSAARARGLAAIARHLRPGGRAALHVPTLAQLKRPLGAPEELAGPYNAAGDRVRIQVIERSFDEAVGRFHQVMDYTLIDSAGAVTRRSLESLTYHWFDEEALRREADPVGLTLERVLGSFEDDARDDAVIYVLERR